MVHGEPGARRGSKESKATHSSEGVKLAGSNNYGPCKNKAETHARLRGKVGLQQRRDRGWHVEVAGQLGFFLEREIVDSMFI